METTKPWQDVARAQKWLGSVVPEPWKALRDLLPVFEECGLTFEEVGADDDPVAVLTSLYRRFAEDFRYGVDTFGFDEQGYFVVVESGDFIPDYLYWFDLEVYELLQGADRELVRHGFALLRNYADLYFPDEAAEYMMETALENIEYNEQWTPDDPDRLYHEEHVDVAGFFGLTLERLSREIGTCPEVHSLHDLLVSRWWEFSHKWRRWAWRVCRVCLRLTDETPMDWSFAEDGAIEEENWPLVYRTFFQFTWGPAVEWMEHDANSMFESGDMMHGAHLLGRIGSGRSFAELRAGFVKRMRTLKKLQRLSLDFNKNGGAW